MAKARSSSFKLKPLPHGRNHETPAILRKLVQAHRALAELKGVASTIPNERILLDTLSLQEAKDSSEIENIITTHDEIYRSDALSQNFTTAAAKEVHLYAQALQHGFRKVQKQGGIGMRTILEMQSIIEESNAGFRKLPGTKLLNDRTGEVVYTPPQDHAEIKSLMQDLERFLNDDALLDADPLVKMAIAHHQFESIHPFYDGNGRTGRIINVLYLVRCDLLDLPILYLSRHITRTKDTYYNLLQEVRKTDDWEPWVLYMLEAIAVTAAGTIELIKGILELMQRYKTTLRDEQPRLYSQDLINSLFRHPYTMIAYMQRDLGISRITATRYLNILVELGLLARMKAGKPIFFLNAPLFRLLQGVGGSK